MLANLKSASGKSLIRNAFFWHFSKGGTKYTADRLIVITASMIQFQQHSMLRVSSDSVHLPADAVGLSLPRLGNFFRAIAEAERHDGVQYTTALEYAEKAWATDATGAGKMVKYAIISMCGPAGDGDPMFSSLQALRDEIAKPSQTYSKWDYGFRVQFQMKESAPAA